MSRETADAAHATTPFLDRLQPLPEAAPAAREGFLRRHAGSLIIGTCSAVISFLSMSSARLSPGLHLWLAAHFPLLPKRGLAGTPGAELLIATVLAYALALVVHELGHVVGGLVAGFRLMQVRFGRIVVDIPFRISRQGPKPGISGQAVMAPVRTQRLEARAAMFIAAGPLANLVSAALVALAPFPKGSVALVFVAASVVLGLSQLVPFWSSRVISDGRCLWLVLRRPTWIRRRLALQQLRADLAQGVPAESLSDAWLAEAVGHVDDTSETIATHMLAHAAAFDRHRDAEAARLLEICLHHARCASPPLRAVLNAQAATFVARRRRDVPLAEAWAADIAPEPAHDWMRASAQAAIREARGDLPGALAQLDEVERLHAATAPESSRRLLRRSLEKWRAELRREQPAARH